MAVYMIQAGENGPVKIGWSRTAVQWRMRQMQGANHQELRIIRLIDGEKALETMCHFHFKELHIRGEWFSFSPKMLTVSIDMLRNLYSEAELFLSPSWLRRWGQQKHAAVAATPEGV